MARVRRVGRPMVVITCEHGGRSVPREYRALFRGARSLLETHRGFDRGALGTARFLAREFRAPLLSSTITRLLVDLNRAETHREVFSSITRSLPPEEREELLARYHRPYRRQADRMVQKALGRAARVVHVSSHSFTPVLDGKVRAVDVGLLYDPSRPLERRLCRLWGHELKRLERGLRVRMNAPYRGTSDGLTRWLRARHAPERYAGVELEISQALADGPLRRVRRTAARSLASALSALASGAAS